MKLKNTNQEETLKKKFSDIKQDNSEFQLWEKLNNGCFIATLGYSEENVYTLLELLKSFEEQYGEKIDYQSAKEELLLYQNYGKLFIYLDENMNPVSMNGCIYNYENETVEFLSPKEKLNTLYFYGLSTIPEYRGKGACRTLINYALEFAKYNNFDLVYARTDLVNSNSEWLMQKSGMELCLYDEKIIAEWVDVTETKGDYRLHMWKPLHEGLECFPKGPAVFAENNNQREIILLSGYQEYSKKYA